MSRNPEIPTAGYGELVRAHRLYVGLTKDAMAHKLEMNPTSYERIENGVNMCPAGFIDTLNELSDAFDGEVSDVISEAKLKLPPGNNSATAVSVDVDPKTWDAWNRAVLGRAAIESGLIMPILVGIDKPQRRAG